MNEKTVIVKRVENNKKADTEEIQKLARSAGYDIVDTLTQSREEDQEYNIGEGKLHETNLCVKEHNAETVIVDNELGPYQMYNIGIYLPDEIDVFDRYTLILKIFEQRADTKKAQLQVKLAKLRYELARAETKARLAKRNEHPGFMGLGEYDESRERDIKNKIKSIKNELNSIEDKKSKRREQRRDDGFDIVAVAGYTNAGKSTLLRRLSESHTVEENEEKHPDLPKTAESTNDYFTTLDTTTRKMDFDKRDVLITDTVGFIDQLPHWLVDAFHATFDSIYRADLVLLTVDATNSTKEMVHKITTCHDVVSRYDTKRIITVFNKCDKISEEELENKKEAIGAIAPNPVCISAKDGDNVSELKERVHRALPPYYEDTLLLPLEEDTMPLVSWVHDNAHVNDCTYTDTNVIIDYEAKEKVIKKAKHKASQISKDE